MFTWIWFIVIIGMIVLGAWAGIAIASLLINLADKTDTIISSWFNKQKTQKPHFKFVEPGKYKQIK